MDNLINDALEHDDRTTKTKRDRQESKYSKSWATAVFDMMSGLTGILCYARPSQKKLYCHAVHIETPTHLLVNTDLEYKQY